MIKVTIITVCKNPGKEILKTLKSIERQKNSNIEYIVIDGYSSDGTIEILKKFKNSGLIDILIHEKDQGIYSAINKGIDLASGDLIGIIHAGDIYTSDAISSAVNIFQDFGGHLSVIVGAMLISYGDSSLLKDDLLEAPKDLSQIKNKMVFNHPSIFVTRNTYLKVGKFDETLRIAADFSFLRKCFLMNENFVISNDIFAVMSYGGISTKISSVFLIAKENYKVRFSYSRNIVNYYYLLNDIVLITLSILKIKFTILFFQLKSILYRNLRY
jgi:glycosyltransferase involved in cell wall biosynthesis